MTLEIDHKITKTHNYYLTTGKDIVAILPRANFFKTSSTATKRKNFNVTIINKTVTCNFNDKLFSETLKKCNNVNTSNHLKITWQNYLEWKCQKHQSVEIHISEWNQYKANDGRSIRNQTGITRYVQFCNWNYHRWRFIDIYSNRRRSQLGIP